MRTIKVFIGIVLAVLIGLPANAAWKFNPHTNKLDYYEASSVTVTTDCSAVTTEGAICWDSDNDTFYIGSGAAAVAIGPGTSLGDVTDVFDCGTGNCQELVAGAADGLNMAAASYSIPFTHATDCSAVVAEGRTCWDTDDNILYIGDGATQVKIIKSGAIVNADIAAAAAIAFSKLAALADGNILVGSGSNVATSVAMSGDATIANTGAVTIAANAVALATDTTGNYVATVADAGNGAITVANSGSENAAVTLDLADNAVTEAKLKAVDSASDEDVLTYESTTGDFEWHSRNQIASGATIVSYADGAFVDFSGITHSGATDEGIVLPTWANVVPTSDKKFLAADGNNLKMYNGGWVTFSATSSGAPSDATYLTASADATLSAEANLGALTTGLLYITVDAGVATPATASEANVETTLGIGFGASKAVTAGYIPVADGTDLEMVAVSGDATLAANGALTIAANSVALTTDTTGNYVATIADAGSSTITVTNGTAEGGAVTLDAVDLHCTDCINATEIEDIYVLIAGDTMSGNLTLDDNSGASPSLIFQDATNETWTISKADAGDLDIVINNASDRTVDISNAGAGAANLTIDGTLTAASVSTGSGTDGQRRIDFTSNTTFTASGNQMYFLNNVAKVAENGTERDIVTPADSVTWTGTTHSFAGVTNMVLPTATPDANGEVGINNTNETLLVYINSGLKTLDFSGDASGYVLKSNGTGTFTLQEDATAGSPTLDTVGDPTADSTIIMDAGEEVNFQYTGNYTTGSQFLIQQLTGNPSGGVLFEVRAADSDSTLARFGDGTNYLQISQAGNVSHAGTSVLTAPRVATSIAPSAAGGATLGTTALEFGNAYFTDSAVIAGQADQSATLTSSASTWTASGFAVSGAFTVAAATSSIPVVVGTGTASGITAAGQMYFESDTEILTIGDGATSIGLDMAPNVVYTFPAATSTLAILGANTFTGTQALADQALTFTTGYIAMGADPADAGAIRLPNAGYIYSEADAAGTDISVIGVDSSEVVQIAASGASGVTITPDVTVTGGDVILVSATAGARLTGGNGTLTIKGEGDGTDEDLTVNLNAANAATISSSTGVTDVSFSALNLATTGTIQGGIKTNSDANGMSSSEMTAVGLYGSMFFATGAGTWNLPAVAAGMSFCVYSTTAAAIVINPDNGDRIILNGTALADGDSITSASGAGDFICLMYDSADGWVTLGRSGTWTDTN